MSGSLGMYTGGITVVHWRRSINPHLLWALALAFVYHGSLLYNGTFKRSYDAFIHIFFADHYARSWFDPWEYRWYTGFTMTSYPPGSQQCIALVYKLSGTLLSSFVVVQIFAILMCTIGMYRFAKIWVSEEAAGYAALLLVFSSCISETVHVFGQLPTTFSLGFLLNALPYAKEWALRGNVRKLIIALLTMAAVTAAHHVTTLFGSIFFVLPVIGHVLVQASHEVMPGEPRAHPAYISRHTIFPTIIRRVRRTIPALLRSAIYGVGLVAVLVIVVLPYWLYTKSDPIAQVPIPHASRDSFIVNYNAGIVFWLIPYGLSLVAFPYVLYKGFRSKAWPMMLSFTALFILGTGGTTPIPRLILRSAFDILTLDRFTFWAAITMMPLVGEFIVSLLHGGLARWLRDRFGTLTWQAMLATLTICYFAIAIIVANFTQFRQFQPPSIDPQPIVSFLDKDQHYRWRYLTLGFGDQMSYLSALTTATTVDGDYNSARRLPELTTSTVERLEGAKYSGVSGIGSLQQFLAVPEKYNLKFVFSNDQFYDPLLYFSGWKRLQRLENGVVVWEHDDIPVLPDILPRKDIPIYQSIMWGTLPIGSIFAALLAMSAQWWLPLIAYIAHRLAPERQEKAIVVPKKIMGTLTRIRNFLFGWLWKWGASLWARFDSWLIHLSQHPADAVVTMKYRMSPIERWSRQYLHPHWIKDTRLQPLDERRKLQTHHIVYTAILCLILATGATGGYIAYRNYTNDPAHVLLKYYDDLDFRRYSDAYLLLDPVTRPSFDQYQLDSTAINGLIASYGKLNSEQVTILTRDPKRIEARIDLVWMTSLLQQSASERQVLVLHNGTWYIQLVKSAQQNVPEQLSHHQEVNWDIKTQPKQSQDIADIQPDFTRPMLSVLSSRLVQRGDQYSVVGELMNTDINPADATVTATLYDAKSTEITYYNAQTVMIHSLLPKEITPFRIDFEGVAGDTLNDKATNGDFNPDAKSPLQPHADIATYTLSAKAVVTDSDLQRDVDAQDLAINTTSTGQETLEGELYNTGTDEATIPHILVTYYDANHQVIWVDSEFITEAVNPLQTINFSIDFTNPHSIQTLIVHTQEQDNIGMPLTPLYNWSNTFPAPASSGFNAFRVSVHYFTSQQ
jgi:hypothetical protein